MSTLIIDRKNAVLAYREGAVELRAAGTAPRRIPLRGIERLILRGAATVSSGLLAQCWERQISVLLLSGRRSAPTARFYGKSHNDAGLRVAQVLACTDRALSLRLAAAVIGAKLRRQQHLLSRLAASRPDGRRRARSGLTALAKARHRLRHAPPAALDSLRGTEGAAAAGYFRSFSAFFAPALGFDGRRRRPPPDPVNAVLSLGYTIAAFEAARCAAIAGLDPAIGALHGLAHGRNALGLDLVEPLRPLVDRLAYDLFHSRTLVDRHFARQPDGGMLLGKAGRRHFYGAWEERAGTLRRLAMAEARMAVRWLRQQPQLWPGQR